MAQLHSSVVALRIWGDDLVPDEVSTLLGALPSVAETKGEELRLGLDIYGPIDS